MPFKTFEEAESDLKARRPEARGAPNAIRRMPTHCGDDTCASCVVAGDTIYLAHHAGGHDKPDVEYQMRASFERMKQTLASVGATLDDMVQINLYLKNIEDFPKARDVFREYFSKDAMPARMSTTTAFVDPWCLCMLDGVAYRPGGGR